MPSSPSQAPSAEHALQLLQLLARHSSPQPAALLARELGLARSTTYRLLGVLAQAGFVHHLAEERRWGLGVAVYELGSAYTRQQPLQRLARPAVVELAQGTGMCAHLATLHGTDVLYVIEERPLGTAPLVTSVGVRLPAAATATGLGMLAELDAAQVRALYPSRDALVLRNPGSPDSPTALRSELAQVRRRGWSLEPGWVTEGFDSVGVAVRDHNGLPAAALAVTWEVRRRGEQGREELVEACRRAARQVAQRIGGSIREPAQSVGS